MVTKFQFDNVFDVDSDGRQRTADETRPHFTEDDLNAARAEGQQIGFEAGLQQARNELEASISSTLQVIAGTLQQIDSRHQQALLATKSEAAELALMIASKLAPELIRREPTAEIEAFIQHCLSEVPTEPRVVIRVAEHLVDALRDNIDQAVTRSGFAGKIALIGEPSMASTDCRIEWADGGAERESAVMQAHIDDAIRRYRMSIDDDIERLEENATFASPEDDVGYMTDEAPQPASAAAEPFDGGAGADPVEDALPQIAGRMAPSTRAPADHTHSTSPETGAAPDTSGGGSHS
jgi:flagellar assembly protein FliH